MLESQVLPGASLCTFGGYLERGYLEHFGTNPRKRGLSMQKGVQSFAALDLTHFAVAQLASRVHYFFGVLG